MSEASHGSARGSAWKARVHWFASPDCLKTPKTWSRDTRQGYVDETMIHTPHSEAPCASHLHNPALAEQTSLAALVRMQGKIKLWSQEVTMPQAKLISLSKMKCRTVHGSDLEPKGALATWDDRCSIRTAKVERARSSTCRSQHPICEVHEYVERWSGTRLRKVCL